MGYNGRFDLRQQLRLEVGIGRFNELGNGRHCLAVAVQGDGVGFTILRQQRFCFQQALFGEGQFERHPLLRILRHG